MAYRIKTNYQMIKDALLGVDNKSLVVLSTKKTVVSKKKSKYEISLCQYKNIKECVYKDVVEKDFEFETYSQEIYDSVEPFTNSQNVIVVFSRDTPLNILSSIFNRVQKRFCTDVISLKSIFESIVGEEGGAQLKIRDVCEKVFTNKSFPEITSSKEELGVLKQLLAYFSENNNIGELRQCKNNDLQPDAEQKNSNDENVNEAVEIPVERNDIQSATKSNSPTMEIGPQGTKLLNFFHCADKETIRYFYVVGIASTGYDVKKDCMFGFSAKKFSLLRNIADEDVKKSVTFFCNPRGEIDPRQLKLYSLDEKAIAMSPTENIFVNNIENYFSETESVDVFFMNADADKPMLDELLAQHGVKVHFENVFSLTDLVKEISEMYGDEIPSNQMNIKNLARLFGCNEDLDFKTLSEEIIGMSRLLGVLLKNYEDYIFEKRKENK